jgi:hypothetical protein
MSYARIHVGLSLAFAMAMPAVLAAQAEHPVSPAEPLPLKLAPRPTTPEITARDLMTRLYIFADDSMMGREVGTEYNLKGTAYIEREVRRLGLVPAGDDGGYFQNIPLFSYRPDSSSTMRIGAQSLAYGKDFLPLARSEKRVVLDGAPVVYGGSTGDTTTWISSAAAAGKVVVLTVPFGLNPFRNVLFSTTSRYGRAAAVLLGSLDRIPAGLHAYLAQNTALKPDASPTVGPVSVYVTPRVVATLLGSTDNLKSGAAGQAISGAIVVHETHAPGRNVVAILPGADRQLKGEYVALGAHNDHIGLRRSGPVDHDSLRAYNIIARPQGADTPQPVLSEAQLARVRAMTDSLHALHGVRRDSINNGADDDGSGTVSLLEIAEAFATSKARPKRSILFVWHTGEEAGLYGSQHYTDHPTVPRDSIVAQLNMDMVGRGGANDVTGETKDGTLVHGGPGYLQLVGSRRLSTELGDLIEQVNREKHHGFTFDYSMDANGHPQNIYCRSDHYSYARYGIPIVFFTTGGHADYHQVTDEPQYIDYDRMAEVASLVYDAAWKIADLDHRVVVDKPKPDPAGACRQ